MCALKKNSYDLRRENKCLSATRETGRFRKYEPNSDDSSDDETGAARTRALSTVPLVLYDIFIYRADSDPNISKMLLSLEQDHHYLVCDQNNFVPGETYFDNFINLMQKSKLLLLVVSKQLLECNLSVFFIKMAVEFHTSEPDYKIIVLLEDVDKSKIPRVLDCFQCVSTKQRSAWISQLCKIIENKCEIRNNGICPSTGHVDATYFTDNMDTTMSDPLPFADISRGLKRKNKILFKKMLADNPKESEDLEILQTVVESVKISYDKNMEYFYRLKNEKKPVFEVVKDYKTEKIRVDIGDIVQLVTTCISNYKTHVIENAIGKRAIVPHTTVLPILTDLPSLMFNTLHLPITEDDNLKFQHAIEKHGFQAVRALQNDLAFHYMFRIDCGDVLWVLDKDGDRVKVRNYKGQEGWVTKCFTEDVEKALLRFVPE